MASVAGQDRIAVVIGAGSGMGTAVAERLHEDGYKLVLADLSAPRFSELSARLNATSLEIDISKPETIAAAVVQCKAGVDALVITAGISASMASFQRIVDVNLGGSFSVLTKFIEVMKPGSAVVCFASMAGHMTGPMNAEAETILSSPGPDLGQRLYDVLGPAERITGIAYSYSKFGVIKLAQKLGSQWGKRGVRVCSISPGVIDTPMGRLEAEKNRETTAQAVAAGPIARLGTPAELANVVSFLCSSQASFVTATDIIVDGGWLGAIRADPESPFATALVAARQNKNEK